MTMLRVISMIIVLLLLTLIVSIFYKVYIYSVIISISIVLMYLYWKYLLLHELVVFQIINNGGTISYEMLLNLFSSNIDKIIVNLVKKKIILEEDGVITLLAHDYKFSFGKR